MHVHLPKPLHGWREFVGEVGIIVLGVGIALAAEQLLETRHWKRVVAAEDRALAEEVQSNHGALFARVLMQPCIDRRLGELAEVFRRHDAGEPLGLIAPIGRPTFFLGSRATLEMAMADQSLSHMSLDRKQAIFATYSAYDAFLSTGAEERSGWRTLQALDHAETLDTNDWRELRRAYDAVSDNNATMKADLKSELPGQWLTPFAPFPQPDRADFVKAFHSLPYVTMLCRPALSPQTKT